MFKRVITIMLALVVTLSLAACQREDEKSDLDKLQEALDGLVVPTETAQDLTLISEGLNGVEITWVSNNKDVISDAGVVTIPLFSEGDKNVKLTATLTLGDLEFTKDFTVTVKAAATETDQEKADEAVKTILFADLTVIKDIDLVDEHLTYPVTWTTSNADFITAEGVVVRPEIGEGNQQVTLTATLTVNDATASKEFVFTVTEDQPSVTYATVAELYANATLDQYIQFTGIVTGVFDGGYFLSDGTDVLGIYAGNNDLSPSIGDEVNVKGFYGVYNTLYQLKDMTKETIVSTGNANPLEGTAQVKTPGEVLALDSSEKALHGKYFSVTGVLEVRGDYGNLYLVDGDDAVLVYYYSLADSITALEAEVGKKVTVTLVYYTDHGKNGPMMMFDGGADDIVVNTLTDAEAIELDTNTLTSAIPAVVVDSFVLPLSGANGTVFSGWTSSHPDLIDNTGAFVGTITETVEVTFTGTATKGDQTTTVEVTIMVPFNSTVEEILAMEDGSLFQITAVVYEMAYYGFYLAQDDHYIFVYYKQYDGPVKVGDEIKALGSKSVYNGLTQVNLKSDIEILSSDNALPMAVEASVEAAEFDLISRGTIATVTGLVSIEGSYNDVFLNGAANGKIKVYYRSNASELSGFEGQIITVNIVTYHDGTVLYQGLAADAVVVDSFTDAQKAQAAADGLDLGDIDNVIEDMMLPATEANSGATITWASSDAAVITDAGVITATIGADTMATLTATVTVGDVVVTREFMVTVLDANGQAPLSVTEALALTDGDSVLVSGVITGKYYDERLIQGADGAAIWVDSNVGGEIGDEIVVRGTLATYDQYGNDNRKLVSATLIETASTDNALVMSDVTDVAAIFAEKHLMQRYTATLTITSLDDGYGYVLFNTVEVDYGEDGIKLEQGFKFKIADFLPNFATDHIVGEEVMLTFTVLDYSFNNVRLVNVSYPVVVEETPELFISEIIEGSSNNKAIELYNPTTEAIDLSGYTVKQNKGSEVLVYTFEAGTMLAAGEVFVLCTDQVEVDSLLDTNCDVKLGYPAVVHFNGDDTVQLYKGDVLIDQFHDEALAGDGNKLYADHTYVRVASVISGVTVFDFSQWVVYDQNDFTHIGAHTTE